MPEAEVGMLRGGPWRDIEIDALMYLSMILRENWVTVGVCV